MYLKTARAVGLVLGMFILGEAVHSGAIRLVDAGAIVALVAVISLLAQSGVVPRNFGGER